MRTRARLAAVFTGLALTGIAAPAAMADGVDAGAGVSDVANLASTDLVNDPVNHVLSPGGPAEKLLDNDANASTLLNSAYEGLGH
ncbi:hypothetical protein C3486_35125 [Streptomyces sp. Ru73]|uniref:hypothetical protein n=1 Tax=Streptomyces sp. Ru73 TaxID=2080748 RepID=UPI000CDE558F|nr:hypothetical protein [Streptomyces sp. Ru73]POX36154.1 hypothetical protein C3486_35125 [Streptomyces sp. Ru73]